LVAVTCPAPLIPYVDDLISKLDRPGTVIEGTGITRNVYNPQWRHGEKLVNLMVKTGISSNASEGADQDAVVAYDAATNPCTPDKNKILLRGVSVNHHTPAEESFQ